MPSTPGTPRIDAPLTAGTASRHDVQVVADQRGQESGGAEAAMRTADGANGLDARLVVEQHAAAAVDLRVDEAGQQQFALQIAAAARASAARVGVAHHVDDAIAFEQHAAPFHHARVQSSRGH